MRTKIKSILTGLIALFLLIGIDQWTKQLAVAYLKNNDGISLIPGVFRLYYLENHGAAFGILQNQQWFFILLAAAFLCLAAFLYLRMPQTRRMLPLKILIVLLAAGAVGNVIDRVIHQYVVDFLYFSLIDFPVFNVADIYVTVSAALLFILVIFYYKDDELQEIFSRKDKNV